MIAVVVYEHLHTIDSTSTRPYSIVLEVREEYYDRRKVEVADVAVPEVRASIRDQKSLALMRPVPA